MACDESGGIEAVCLWARARVWGARARAPRACALGIEEYVLY